MSRPIGRNIVAVCEALEQAHMTAYDLGQYLEGWGYEKARQYAKRAWGHGFVSCTMTEPYIYTVAPNWRELVDKRGISKRDYVYRGRAPLGMRAIKEIPKQVATLRRNSVFDVGVQA